ncbi:MAG: hypothetical protein P8Y36_06610, partial [Alphaproteobacteria bacterium]
MRRLSTLAIFMLFAASPAYATEIAATSKITAVTVFPSGAQVTRTMNIKLEAGEHSIHHGLCLVLDLQQVFWATEALGVSRGTVQNRLDKLLSQGEILGFTVRMRAEETIAGVRAITLISEQTKNTSAVLKALRQIPEAKAIHTTNGRWDIMV